MARKKKGIWRSEAPASGAEYLSSLQDGREVWYHGERIKDVTSHPLFAPAARVLAAIYEMFNTDPELHYETETGSKAFTPYLTPKNVEDLVRIRKAQEKIHRFHLGLILQGPEYKGPVVSGLGMAAPYFAPYSENVQRYAQYVRDQRLYVANAFTDPQVDRSKRPSELPNPDLVLRVVEERDDGVVLRGAKMASTTVPFTHELLILRYGGSNRLTTEDADYAFIGAVPINAPGLKIFCRQVFRPQVADWRDAPFSWLFDEIDAFLVFEDVFVPWERVFVYRDPEKADNWLMQTNMAVSLIYVDLVRWITRFRFLTAQAVKIAKANGTIMFRGQQERLGEMIAITRLLQDLVDAGERNAVPYYDGVMVNPETVLSFRAIRPMLFKRMNDLAREVAGSGAALIPSSIKDIEAHPELEEYARGAFLGGRERTLLYKAFWDLVHSDWAARSELSERLHTGNVSDVKAQLFFGAHGMEMDRHYDEAMAHIYKLIDQIKEG